MSEGAARADWRCPWAWCGTNDPGRDLCDRCQLRADRAALREALQRISQQQPKTLAVIESNGFVFDSVGNEPGNWQHLAFTIYTDLCEVDTIARAALEAR